MKFRKKPVVVEAVQWSRNVDEMRAFCGDVALFEFSESGPHLSIRTLEGTMDANPGDWIIRGVKGELYPCKPDIFAATYMDAEQLYECTCPMCEHHTTARKVTP